jgi:glycyl-tRNA synthetase
MAEPKENALMEKIVSLCKRRGFIYQSSEIYGGINGFWDYGPLGAELKRNVKDLWWNTMTRQRDDVVGLEATIIMSPQIWKASGHVDTFSDPMCDCLLTKKRFRADQIEPQSGIVYYYSGVQDDSYNYFLHSKEIKDAIPDWEEAVTKNSNERPGSVLTELVIKHLINSPERAKQKLGKDFLEAARGERMQPISYAVLLPAGKPPESARKIAVQFYQQRGYVRPKLLGERTEKVENSQRFNPENGSLLSEPRPFNLMFKTSVGPLDVPSIPSFDSEEEVDIEELKAWEKAYDEWQSNVVYLRPETAQAIFAQFKNVLETSRQKVPFGIAQVGKAFRNEVTPRNYTFRSREFEQMELEFFIKPDEVVEAICGKVATAAEAGSRVCENAESGPRSDETRLQTNWGWEAWHKYWVEERIKFYEGIGLPRNTLVEYWQKPEELAHYARATVDILYKFPFSKRDEQGELMGEELEGIAARSDFDLSQHERFSGKPMGVFDEELRAAWGKLDEARKAGLSKRYYEARLKYLAKTGVEPAKAEREAKEDADGLAKGQYIPHVIEPSAGVDRLILALICNAYHEDQMPDEKGKLETRVVLKFHPRVAPIKVAVLPLLKNKPELVKKAREVRDLLRPWMNAFYDDAGAIGRRYRRQDEAGTPFCVTIDFDTLGEKPELKDTVTMRYRDDGKQERLAIGELLNWLLPKIR